MSFELHSRHLAVLDRARVIFAPWLIERSDPPTPRVRFLVEPHAGSRWRVSRQGDVDAVLESLDLALTTVEYRAVASLLEPDSGVVAIHAALVSRAGRGVLLAGPKESGKTTLACALWRRGWSLHSDDTTLVDDGPVARGIARRISLRATSRSLLGADLWERIEGLPGTTRTSQGSLFHPREARAEPAAEDSVAVAAVVFLGRRGATPPAGGTERIDPARGLIALAPYCNQRDAGIGRALAALQPLADRARFFDLGRGGLTEMTERVEAAAAS
ncbi:MAG TPA: hypothetical protein VMR66_00280 [Gemmatimonadota bacterium]|nr:hypothetical protein [Gemmatimonadota bacterium]